MEFLHLIPRQVLSASSCLSSEWAMFAVVFLYKLVWPGLLLDTRTHSLSVLPLSHGAVLQNAWAGWHIWEYMDLQATPEPCLPWPAAVLPGCVNLWDISSPVLYIMQLDWEMCRSRPAISYPCTEYLECLQPKWYSRINKANSSQSKQKMSAVTVRRGLDADSLF